MKKYLFSFVAFFVMCMASLALVSCGDDDEESGSDSIVGSWVVVGNSTNITTYRFNSDGTGTITDDGGVVNIKYTYTVTATSNTLQLWPVNSSTLTEYSVQKTGDTLMLTRGSKTMILERK